MLSDDN